MNKLVESFNKAETVFTDNGDNAFNTSESKVLDFFSENIVRGQSYTKSFIDALGENEELAIRALLHLRDVREGKGERRIFRDLLWYLVGSLKNKSTALRILSKIPEIGRFDDLIHIAERVSDNDIKSEIVKLYSKHLKSGNGLAYKWVKIKGGVAKLIRKEMGFKTEKEWRKHVVTNRQTVEQQLCAKEFDQVEYSKLPSLAMSKYLTSFYRNDQQRFESYKNSLVKGEAKINSSVLMPYEIIRNIAKDETIAEEQWKALDFGIDANVLPVVDNSGSMRSQSGVNGVFNFELAFSLGLLLSEKNKNENWRNIMCSFSENPKIYQIPDTLKLLERLSYAFRQTDSLNTDMYRVFEEVIRKGRQNNLTQKDMPSTIVVFTDMEFDQYNRDSFVRYEISSSFKERVTDLYKGTGYEVPEVIIWNLSTRTASKLTHIKKNDYGFKQVSGFNANLFKQIFKGTSSYELMLEVLGNERYNF